jgi:hypothetical protein
MKSKKRRLKLPVEAESVGWVERSDTHRVVTMGWAFDFA